MNRFSAAALCLLLAVGCSESAPAGNDQPAAGPDISFVSGARLIPGDGTEPIEAATMIVENGMIKEIGAKGELKAPKGSARVELEGTTLMPLLINLQAYPGLNNAGSFGPANYKRDSVNADLSRSAYYGVAAVLAFGTDSGDLALQVRDDQKSGKAGGSRLFTSGRGLAPKGNWPAGLGDMPARVASEAEARKAVSDMVAKKVDVITMWVNDAMPAAAYQAAIDEAHKANLKVFAEAPNLAVAKGLVDSGVDGFVGSIRDKEVDDALISAMKSKNVFLAPALSALEARFVYADNPDWLGEQSMREVYPATLSAYLNDPVTVNRIKRNPELGSYRQQFQTASANLKKLSAGGVKIAFASGSGSPDTFPGYFEHRELELMGAAGMTPADIIKAATVNSAEAIGAADMGALAPGKRADFMILPNNPLEKISNAKAIDRVYVGGHDEDRLEMVRNIVVEVPKISSADRAADAAQQRKDEEAAAEAKMPHYGKFVLGSPTRLAGIALQTPKRSNAVVSNGPPAKLTVTLAGASGADLRDFYAATLRAPWTASGNCWERPDPVKDGAKQRICAEIGGNQITLTAQ